MSESMVDTRNVLMESIEAWSIGIQADSAVLVGRAIAVAQDGEFGTTVKAPTCVDNSTRQPQADSIISRVVAVTGARDLVVIVISVAVVVVVVVLAAVAVVVMVLLCCVNRQRQGKKTRQVVLVVVLFVVVMFVVMLMLNPQNQRTQRQPTD